MSSFESPRSNAVCAAPFLKLCPVKPSCSLGPRELGLGSTKKKWVFGDLRGDYLRIGSTRSVGRPRRGYLRLGSTKKSVGRPSRSYLRLSSTKKSVGRPRRGCLRLGLTRGDLGGVASG